MKFKDAPKKVQDTATFIGAVIAIGTALVGAGRWIVSEVNASTNARMDAIEQKIDDNQKNNNLAIMRLELMNLMQTDPENVVEIERVGRDYFSAGGDYYMSGLFSKWAQTHGADATFVIAH